MGIETVSATVLMAGMLFDRLFDRPHRSIADYLELTQHACRLYAADLPTPEQVAAHRASLEVSAQVTSSSQAAEKSATS
jgi:hypothetical protein